MFILGDGVGAAFRSGDFLPCIDCHASKMFALSFASLFVLVFGCGRGGGGGGK